MQLCFHKAAFFILDNRKSKIVYLLAILIYVSKAICIEGISAEG
jgi:hypothetical protein